MGSLPRVFVVLFALTYCGSIGAQSLIYSCKSCHGAQLQGREAIHAPALAGQGRDYLATQLQKYRDGLRGAHPQDRYGAQMALIASNLTDAQIDELATQIGNLPSEVSLASIQHQLYATCAVCHGGSGEGNVAMRSPALAGLDRIYLVDQLRHFRDGVRGAHPQDALGRLMAMSLPVDLTDAQIELLADLLDPNG